MAIKLSCDYCGDEFEKYPSEINDEENYCSKKCYQTSVDAKETCKCNNCGEKFQETTSRIKQGRGKFCSIECKHESGQEEVVCDYCGEKTTKPQSFVNMHEKNFCDKECEANWTSENNRGKDHPNWKEKSLPKNADYGYNWAKMRERTLERDNHMCKICGKTEEEIGRKPSVHHIKPLRTFDKPEEANYLDNLVALCKEHHRELEQQPVKVQKNRLGIKD